MLSIPIAQFEWLDERVRPSVVHVGAEEPVGQPKIEVYRLNECKLKLMVAVAVM